MSAFQWPKPATTTAPAFGATTGTGATPTQTVPSAALGLFGAQAQPQPQVQGQTTTATTAPTGFGGYGAFGQSTAPTNPITTTTTMTGTNGGTTGATGMGAGLFGAQTQQPKPFSFGTTPMTTTMPGAPAAGASLFGNPASTMTGAATAPATTGFTGYGAGLGAGTTGPAAVPTQPGAMTGTSQFGGLFGGTAGAMMAPASNPPAGTSSIFGAQPVAMAPPAAPTQPQAQTSSIFGQSLAAPVPQQHPNQSTILTMSQLQSQQPQNSVSMIQKITELADRWDPKSPNHPMQYYFYNVVDPAQVHLYGRPFNATDEALWKKAVRENPNPSTLVPVLAVGMDDLRRRVDVTKTQAQLHITKLHALSQKTTTLLTQHTTRTAPQLSQVLQTHVQLTQRLALLIRHLHLLIPSVRSSTMRPEEEKLRGVLEGVEGELSRPGGLGRTDGRVGELWGKVNRAKVVYGSGSAQGRREDGWAVVDENGMKELAKLLEEQQRGLEHVTSVLQKAIKDLGVLETHLGGNSSSTGVSPSKGYGVGRR